MFEVWCFNSNLIKGLNLPIETYRLTEQVKKKQKQLYSAYKKFTGNNIECEKDRKPKILNPSRNKSEQGYLFLISDKTKIKKIKN